MMDTEKNQKWGYALGRVLGAVTMMCLMAIIIALTVKFIIFIF